MRWIKRVLWAVLALGLALAVAGGIYVQRSLPQLDGQLRLSVLKGPVEPIRVREKERIAGVWMNAGATDFRSAPFELLAQLQA